MLYCLKNNAKMQNSLMVLNILKCFFSYGFGVKYDPDLFLDRLCETHPCVNVHPLYTTFRVLRNYSATLCYCLLAECWDKVFETLGE